MFSSFSFSASASASRSADTASWGRFESLAGIAVPSSASQDPDDNDDDDVRGRTGRTFGRSLYCPCYHQSLTAAVRRVVVKLSNDTPVAADDDDDDDTGGPLANVSQSDRIGQGY